MPPTPPMDDATVVIRQSPVTEQHPPASPPRRPRWGWVAAGLAAAGSVAAVGWIVIHGSSPSPTPPEKIATVATAPAAPAPAQPPVAPPPAAAAQATTAQATAPAPPVVAPFPPPAPSFKLLVGDETAIAAHSADDLTVFRFAAAPSIVVLDFPTLLSQGKTLNRVAALIEKAGQPHDRVLTDAELETAVKAHGDTTATYYYGHDYTAAALARFFALADRESVKLSADEERLRTLLIQLGWLSPGAQGALISVSRAGADADITPATRAAILHHELSHGAFFTDAGYAAYVRGFWQTTLSAKERAALRHFLTADGYEPGDEDLTVNEMQAYLIFTHDHDFFDIAEIGLTRSRRAQLEAAFRHGMPDSWIRSMPAEPPLPGVISAACGPAQSCR